MNKSGRHQSKKKEETKNNSRYVDSNGNPILFSLWCNDSVHQIPVNTMVRVSKRCLSLAKFNDFQGSINHPVSEEALSAFLLACQLKPFKVTASNAYELLDLSKEWLIGSLEKYVTEFISNNKIKPHKEYDFLGRLISEQENDEIDNDKEILGIAKNINKTLSDKRLSNVNPEHLFRILSQANLQTVNKQKLTNFIMSLFDTDPERAVPLSLKLDFDYLNNEQIEEIFQTRSLHEQSIGYFMGKSISDIRNTDIINLINLDVKFIRSVQDIKEHIAKHRAIKMDNVEEYFSNEYKELKKLVAAQQKQISYLKKMRDGQRKAMKSYQKSYQAKRNQLFKEFERIEKVVSEVHETQNERLSVIRGHIDEGVAPITKSTLQTLSSITSQNFHKRNLVKKSLDEWCSRYIQNLNDVKLIESSAKNAFRDLSDRIVDTRAALAAKILKDQLRRDSFLRNIDNMWQIFEIEPKFWDLNADQVKLAQQKVDMMESKVRNSCPIKTKHSTA